MEKEYFDTEDLKQNLKGRAVSGAAAAVFGEVSRYGIQMVGTIILARILSPDDFGLVAMVVTFSMLLQNFGVNGFIEAVIQEKGLDHNKTSSLFWISTCISFALSVLFALSSPVLVWLYGDPRLKNITIVLSLSIFSSGLSALHRGLLARRMQFYRVMFNDMAATAVSILLAIILSLNGAGYWSLVARRIALPLATTIGAWLLCRWRPGLFKGLKDVVHMVKFAVHVYGNFILTYFSRNLDKVLIGWKYGTVPLGQYSNAYHLFVMPTNQLTIPLTNVSIATLSRLRDDKERYQRYYLKALTFLAFLGLPIGGLVALTGTEIVFLLLGPQWGQAGRILTLFGWGIGAMILYSSHGWIYLSLGQAERWFRWSIISLFAVSAAVMAGLFFGAEGVALAYSLSFYILLWPAIGYGGKKIGLRLRDVFKAIWKHFVAAILAFAASLITLSHFAQALAGQSWKLVLFRLVVKVFIYAVTYLVFTIILHRGIRPLKELISVAKEMVPTRSRK